MLKHIDKSNFNINLIPINTIKESIFKRPSKDRIDAFVSVLNEYHINNTIRRELGSDISGSCGQLRYTYIYKES